MYRTVILMYQYLVISSFDSVAETNNILKAKKNQMT